MTTFSRELKRWQSQIQALARRAGLDFYPIVFDVVDFKEMAEVASYHGFPDHFSHWKFGEEYENMRKQFSYGLGKIYEMVINTVPALAYLLEENKLIDHKIVMAHVCAHVDFFKNNTWFAPTDRNMLATSRAAAERIDKYREEFGEEVVDDFITDCFKIKNLIDFRLSYLVRFNKKENEKLKKDEGVLRFKSDLPYLDRFLNPPDWIEKQKKQKKIKEEMAADIRKGLKFPAEPVRDILLFLLEFAPLENWQRDILDIFRQESYYLWPQALTKIANEGWAAYWHSELVVRHKLALSAEIIDYSKHNAGTLGGSGFNPYKLGLTIFQDIEYRWNTGRHGLLWKYCRPFITKKEQWDDFAVFKNIYEETQGKVADDWAEWCVFKKICREGRHGFPKDIFRPQDLALWWSQYQKSSEIVKILEKESKQNRNPDLEDDIKSDLRWYRNFLKIKRLWQEKRIKKESDPIPEIFFVLAKKYPGKIELGRGREKIFEVRIRVSDLGLIKEFFTKSLFEKLPMFSFKPGGGGVAPDHWGVDKADFESVKKKLLFSLFNNSQPVLEITDARYSRKPETGGGLYFKHQHEGVDLKINEMIEIIRVLFKIWQAPVYLETVLTDEEKQINLPFHILRQLGVKSPEEKKIKKGKNKVFFTENGKDVSVLEIKEVEFEAPY